MRLLPFLDDPTELCDRVALQFGERTLTYGALADSCKALRAQLIDCPRVAVWATPRMETAIAVAAALLAGVPVVPVNAKAGVRELEHISGDARPDAVLAAIDDDVPTWFAPRRIDVPSATTSAVGRLAHADPTVVDLESVALILYTSGTTGSPKGVLLPGRAIASNIDALATAWQWTSDDVLTHALPLFHAHGLVLGTIGVLRLGGTLIHTGHFTVDTCVGPLASGAATMLFGVPTMYARLADAAEQRSDVAGALARARLLVSGSAALPAAVHARIEASTGQRVVERYGLSETLMNCAIRVDGERRPGTVGPPVDGVALRLVDDVGAPIEPSDDSTIGEIEVRGPNVFLGYLNRADATAEAMHEGWFRTGDLATRAADGYIRIVGRKATDLIKTGGYKVGAGEVENALLEHPAVAEAAVKAEPDDDLGERIVAWVVLREGVDPAAVSDRLLAEHVGTLISAHKRPRVVHFVESLPRNDMGKVVKARLS